MEQDFIPTIDLRTDKEKFEEMRLQLVSLYGALLLQTLEAHAKANRLTEEFSRAEGSAAVQLGIDATEAVGVSKGLSVACEGIKELLNDFMD